MIRKRECIAAIHLSIGSLVLRCSVSCYRTPKEIVVAIDKPMNAGALVPVSQVS